MDTPANRQKDAIALGEFVSALEGKALRVSQAISWRPGTDFERHSTVLAQFEMLVEKASWVMSGGHYVLYGQGGSLYYIGTTKLQSVEITPVKAKVLERYGNEAERLSTLEVIERRA